MKAKRTITYNFIDSFGNTISGNYHGRLPYINLAGSSFSIEALKSKVKY